jgi:hypothetical protein
MCKFLVEIPSVVEKTSRSFRGSLSTAAPVPVYEHVPSAPLLDVTFVIAADKASTGLADDCMSEL